MVLYIPAQSDNCPRCCSCALYHSGTFDVIEKSIRPVGKNRMERSVHYEQEASCDAGGAGANPISPAIIGHHAESSEDGMEEGSAGNPIEISDNHSHAGTDEGSAENPISISDDEDGIDHEYYMDGFFGVL